MITNIIEFYFYLKLYFHFSACCIHPIDQVINECDGAKKCNETDC